jgi:hypothetical protein
MKIEDFIENNRLDFEEEPSAKVWKGIEQNMSKKPSIWANPKFRLFAGAAILFCCIGIGYYLGIHSTSDSSYADNMPEMANQNMEFVRFTKNLDEKKEIFNKLVSQQPALEEVFLQDIEALDQDYQALKSQIQTNPNKEQILEAMIDNLRYQEQILNTQTQILERTNKTQAVDLL